MPNQLIPFSEVVRELHRLHLWGQSLLRFRSSVAKMAKGQ